MKKNKKKSKLDFAIMAFIKVPKKKNRIRRIMRFVKRKKRKFKFCGRLENYIDLENFVINFNKPQ
jgi:hypothetical protein